MLFGSCLLNLEQARPIILRALGIAYLFIWLVQIVLQRRK